MNRVKSEVAEAKKTAEPKAVEAKTETSPPLNGACGSDLKPFPGKAPGALAAETVYPHNHNVVCDNADAFNSVPFHFRPPAAGITKADKYNSGEGEGFVKFAIPVGDPGEQLVANLILSLIVCQLHTLSNAIPYIAQAHELAVTLERQTITYRPDFPSKFAQMELELHGSTQTLLFPFINNVLVIPTVGAADLLKTASTASATINLTKLNVARFMLRLRTRRLAAAIQTVKMVESPEELTEATHRILTKCFYREIAPAHPVDRADDCIMLSRALIEKRNFQLAAVALKSADTELDLYVQSSPLKEHPASIRKTKEQIAAILRELGSGAA